MRSLDDLDSFQVVDRLIGTTRARDIYAVIVQRNARTLLGRSAIRRDAADHDTGIVGALFLNVETRDVIRQLVEIGDAQSLDLFVADGADRDRHVLRTLLDLLSRYDNFVARLARPRSRILRCDPKGAEKRRAKHDGDV